MSFKNIDLEISYISYGEDGISKKLLIPALKEAKYYKRSIGFFSSSVFQSIYHGIKTFMSKDGKIMIITSPKLSQEDIEVIKNSYDVKNKIINETIDDVANALQDIDDEARIFLANLIIRNILDIKIVVTRDMGYYHDKFGILEDFEGNKIAFVGSSNETLTGLELNYEKIRVFNTWSSDFETNHVLDEENEFDLLWNDTNPHVYTYEFNQALKKVAFEIISESKGEQNEPYKLRSYQREAIEAWKKNGNNGFFVMATGTGKTITALYAFKKLLEETDLLVIIAVPYIHLIAQWNDDVSVIYPDANVVRVYGEDPKWPEKIEEYFIDVKYNSNENRKLIVISTMKSFGTDKFEKSLRNFKGDRLLLVDEAHRFYNKAMNGIEYSAYGYRLGLSATPVFGKNIEKAKSLLNFFGGKVYELTIDDAIGKFLVNYIYTPIKVPITLEEESMFKKKTAQMASCFDAAGNMIDIEKFIRVHKERLRILAMATNKNEYLRRWITEKKPTDQFIVYCGDGKIYDDNQDGLRHLDSIKTILNSQNYRPTQFTANESLDQRLRIIKLFQEGEISSIVAIKCLDEGINIPSIKTAIILSSGDDYREFVQRRGRILRKYRNKETAEIIDFILIPTLESQDIARIELRRYYEYARLALNSKELLSDLNVMMERYGINYDEINFEGILESIDGGEIDD